VAIKIRTYWGTLHYSSYSRSEQFLRF